MNLAPIAPQYRCNAPTTLVLREKKMSLTGDSAEIKDSIGNTRFKVDAHNLSLSERRTLTDAATGAPLAQLRRKKMPGFHAACYIGTMDDEKVCTVKVKGLLNVTKCDANIYLGDDKVGSVSGNWRAKEFSIKIDGKEIATIARKTSMTSLMLDADSYCINVNEAGVDVVFVSLITLAFFDSYCINVNEAGVAHHTCLG